MLNENFVTMEIGKAKKKHMTIRYFTEDLKEEAECR